MPECEKNLLSKLCKFVFLETIKSMTRNRFPRHAPGATIQGNSAIKVTGVEHQDFYLEQYG